MRASLFGAVRAGDAAPLVEILPLHLPQVSLSLAPLHHQFSEIKPRPATRKIASKTKSYGPPASLQSPPRYPDCLCEKVWRSSRRCAFRRVMLSAVTNKAPTLRPGRLK